MAKALKIGVIGGLGSIGKRHAASLKNLGCEVVVCDPSEAPLAFTELNQLKNCDGVVIASPTSTHLDYLSWCAENSLPVLVEKPLGDDILHAELALSLAKEKNVPVFVGFNLRFHSCVIQAKARLPGLGSALWANFTVAQRNERPDYLRDGVCLNWLSHEIDLALHLFGPAQLLTAVGDDQRMVDMVLLHDSGTQTTLHGDYLTKPEIRGFRVAGTKGNFFADLVSRHTMTLEDRYIWSDSFDENYKDEMRAFVFAITGECVPLATGIEGLAGMKLCLAAREMIG